MSDLRQAAYWLVTATNVLDRWDREHGHIVNSERDVLASNVDEAWSALRIALAIPCSHPDSWFDRSICPVDDWMHTRCSECGGPLDGECGEEGDQG